MPQACSPPIFAPSFRMVRLELIEYCRVSISLSVCGAPPSLQSLDKAETPIRECRTIGSKKYIHAGKGVFFNLGP